jgi:hypothetical protein
MNLLFFSPFCFFFLLDVVSRGSQHHFTRPLFIIRSRPRWAHPLPHHSPATSLRSPARSFDSVATSLRSPVCMIRSRPRCARFSLIIRSQLRFPGQLAALRLVVMDWFFIIVLCIHVFRSLARSLIIRSYHRFTRPLLIISRPLCAHPLPHHSLATLLRSLAHDSVATSLRSPARTIRSRLRCARFSVIIRSRPRFPGQLAATRFAAMNSLFFSPSCVFFTRCGI